MAASPNFPSLPAGWREEEISFNNSSLFLRIWWNPSGNSERALYVVHGFGEQSDRYSHLPHYLGTSVDVVAAIDLPGHGKSAGQRGHCDSFTEMSDAALEGLAFLQGWLIGKNLKKKISWVGHSLGGLATILALKDRADLPLASVILSAPLIALSMPVPAVKKFFGELITPILPRLPLENSIDGMKLSRDPSVGIEYKRNPLNHSKITPRMFREMTNAMQAARDWLGPLNYSTLLILPLNDEVVDASVTLKRWKEWSVREGRKKELTQWPMATHESMNDLDKTRVFNAIENWLEKT